MRERGFTLLEVVLATLILSIIATLTWGALSATFRTQTTITERTALAEVGTAALSKIRDDLSQAFMVESIFQLSYFKGESSGDRDKMSFTSFTHDRSGPNTHEGDQAEIVYDTESDTTTRLNHLRRKETRDFWPLDNKAEGDTVVLAKNIVSFHLEYSDGETFKTTWDSRGDENRNKLPKAVRAVLVLRDERGREETYEDVVEIPMAEGIGVQQAGQQGTPVATPTPRATPTSRGGRSG
ncbi:MAG: prepilin-type N-terminal cleavage/methylation domain-containing protein [Pseudomonadota bacterium]